MVQLRMNQWLIGAATKESDASETEFRSYLECETMRPELYFMSSMSILIDFSTTVITSAMPQMLSLLCSCEQAPVVCSCTFDVLP